MEARIPALVAALFLITTGAGASTLAVPTELAPLSAATAALETGAYGDGLRKMAAVQGYELPAEPTFASSAHALASLSHGEVDAIGASLLLAEVPADLLPAVTTLVVGLAKADLLVERANAELPPDALHRLLAPTDGWVGEAINAEVEAPIEPDLPHFDRLDIGSYVQADALLADAITAALPMLADLGPLDGGATPDAVSYLVDLRPVLAIAGTGDDVYTPADNAILMIDLGGDDTYANAQGTPFGIPGLAQLIVDVQGNDDYVQQTVGTGTLSVVAQGVGALGVGGIVDVMGNDRYIAKASYLPSDDPVAAAVAAQGVGLLGAGLLMDLGGFDCVQADARSLGASAGTVAQGAGVLGAGLFVWLGSGTRGGSDGVIGGCLPGPDAIAFADPLVLVDTPQQFQAQLGFATVLAQGATTGGLGAAVGGIGEHVYRAAALGGGAAATAQGAGVLGAGALVDLGGGDLYLAASDVFSSVSVDLVGEFSFVSASTFIELADTVTVAQGAARTGVAALSDVGTRPDTRIALASASAIAFSRAVSTVTFQPVTAIAESEVIVGDVLTFAQGAGDTGMGLSADAGTPMALGPEGSDLNFAFASLFASSNAIAGGTDPSSSATASTATGNSEAIGQGAGRTGVGAFADAGGSDAYLLTALLTAHAFATVDLEGTATKTVTAGVPVADGQGEGSTGAGVLADVDGSDTYIRTPGGSEGMNDHCWTHSPPSQDLDIGIGADLLSTLSSPLIPTSCLLPPN